MGWSFGGFMQGLGSAFGLYKDEEAKKAAEDAAKAQSNQTLEVAAHNKELSLYDERVTRESAQQAEIQMTAQVAMKSKALDKVLDTQRARMAAGGVIMSTGTALEVQATSAGEAAAEIDQIIHNGEDEVTRRRNLADRYAMLAEYGMKDAVLWANQIEKAGDAKADAFMYDGIGQAITGIYTTYEAIGGYEGAVSAYDSAASWLSSL